jgi:hypothetical protein
LSQNEQIQEHSFLGERLAQHEQIKEHSFDMKNCIKMSDQKGILLE